MTSKCARLLAARLIVLGGTLALAIPAAAQKQTFDLESLVMDAQQGVLPGATVTFQNDATRLTRETTTDAEGGYWSPHCGPRDSTSCSRRSRSLRPNGARA